MRGCCAATACCAARPSREARRRTPRRTLAVCSPSSSCAPAAPSADRVCGSEPCSTVTDSAHLSSRTCAWSSSMDCACTSLCGAHGMARCALQLTPPAADRRAGGRRRDLREGAVHGGWERAWGDWLDDAGAIRPHKPCTHRHRITLAPHNASVHYWPCSRGWRVDRCALTSRPPRASSSTDGSVLSAAAVSLFSAGILRAPICTALPVCALLCLACRAAPFPAHTLWDIEQVH